MKTVHAPSQSECYKLMLEYATETFKQDHNFVVKWHKEGLDQAQISFFRGKDEDEVRTKFYHDNDGNILEVVLMPIS